ncbi:nuclear transport factor 2 family protein [Mycolicibacterium sp. CH28]|uniref:nuclear transport factor 2 family protein n=1 Tax=Mycolicibacterium sp. CH28 TaxID=2512237 RepID=UPI0013866DEA|nr:nuclear transport factor 2 family protein [Mycolicibacterium sp. CH28]
MISAYLAASERRDVDAIVACFSDDATVLDEGTQRRGLAEIRRWREDVDTTFEYTSKLMRWSAGGVTDRAQRYDVTLHLQGNFPGGGVDLVNSFTVRDGHIADLRIVPATS